MKQFLKGFAYAWQGIVHTVKTERNMRVHLCMTFYVISLGIAGGFLAWQWVAALLCIGLVTALEIVNTALEKLCDKVCPEKDETVGIVKDAAAGAVLAASVASAAVGLVLFLQPYTLLSLLNFVKETPAVAVALVILLPVWIFVIRGRKRNDK